MSMIATSLKSLLKIKVKERNDSYTDQYNRIFMVKIMLACCIIMGISWYKDAIKCVVTSSSGMGDSGFVSQACWIQGLYIYKNLIDKKNEVAYFGIPKDMDLDGTLTSGELCSTSGKLGTKNEKCIPMEKRFILQYQWMPFLIGALSALYYIPYLLHGAVNRDIKSLLEVLKSDKPNAVQVCRTYFNRRANPYKKMFLRSLLNIIVKILYIVVNFITLFGLNNVLFGKFNTYGQSLIKWSTQYSSQDYDYMGTVNDPTPGNLILPPFGYCELYESSKDIKHSTANSYKFICELSQNILYQYCFIILWFSIVLGIIVSFVGLLILIVRYVTGMFKKQERNMFGEVIKSLSLREAEYMEIILKKRPDVYKEVNTLLMNGDDSILLNEK
ncbi:innexin inx3 isoform X2 [Hydra vulgaris]|uniref:Innexin n=1 Tax=Hydra vulgaris TaxID=6087 RepID=A0A5B8HTC8_HYDVU|nr:innexin 13 [Hydra vulgaris]